MTICGLCYPAAQVFAHNVTDMSRVCGTDQQRKSCREHERKRNCSPAEARNDGQRVPETVFTIAHSCSARKCHSNHIILPGNAAAIKTVFRFTTRGANRVTFESDRREPVAIQQLYAPSRGHFPECRLLNNGCLSRPSAARILCRKKNKLAISGLFFRRLLCIVYSSSFCTCPFWPSFP